MKKSLILLAMFLTSVFTVNSLAMNIDWSGVYRVEAYSISNSALVKNGREKDYGLHHLVLRPKIIAADDLTIFGRFDFLNSADSNYTNSAMGQFLGSGINTSGSPGSSEQNSNILSQRQASDSVAVNELYAVLKHPFGSFMAGRMPVHFGLGITHNAGRGEFDHWFDNRDGVAYKMVFGNFYLMPMFAKVVEGNLHENSDITDYIIQLKYENPDSDLQMGVYYQVRKANVGGNDSPVGTSAGDLFGGAGASLNERHDSSMVNLFVEKKKPNFRFGLEGSFQSGKTGVQTSSGGNVTFGGYGVATEFEWEPKNSYWQFGLKAGMVSGDDANTDDKYEGFLMDRNYDVAFLMFNHPVGTADLLKSSLGGGSPGSPISTADTEVLTNATYISPSFNFEWSKNVHLNLTLTTGWLMEEAISNQDSKDLGYEADLAIIYRPHERFVWRSELGWLTPGKAFELNGTVETDYALGFVTKAAISF